MKEIVNNYTSKHTTNNTIKKAWIDQYNLFTSSFGDTTNTQKIIDILIDNGNQIKNKKIDLESFLQQDDYHFSKFDIWSVMSYYNIPSIMISETEIFGDNQGGISLYNPANIQKNSNLIVIFDPINTYPNFIAISFKLSNIVNEECSHEITELFSKYIPIQTYINKYSKQ